MCTCNRVNVEAMFGDVCTMSICQSEALFVVPSWECRSMLHSLRKSYLQKYMHLYTVLVHTLNVWMNRLNQKFPPIVLQDVRKRQEIIWLGENNWPHRSGGDNPDRRTWCSLIWLETGELWPVWSAVTVRVIVIRQVHAEANPIPTSTQ